MRSQRIEETCYVVGLSLIFLGSWLGLVNLLGMLL